MIRMFILCFIVERFDLEEAIHTNKNTTYAIHSLKGEEYGLELMDKFHTGMILIGMYEEEAHEKTSYEAM